MEYKEKLTKLQEESFTYDFKENKIVLDVWFDNFKRKHYLTEKDSSYDGFLDYYENGELLTFIVDIKSNDKQLKEVIKDFEKYQELTDILYDTRANKDQVDLITVVDYIENKFRESIIYDNDTDDFYYKSDED